MKKFEQILGWQKAKELTLIIYRDFQDTPDRNFKSQIQRASVSIMNNIAEGFECNSDKELKHFLFVAKGSAGEVRSMLELALSLGYLEKDQHKKAHELCVEVSRLLGGFIRRL